jgi:O-antigen ligase
VSAEVAKILATRPCGDHFSWSLLPGAVDRMLYGLAGPMLPGKIVDDYEVTSGRTLVWPYVIAKIGEAPIVGYGRLAMNRTGVTDQLMLELDEPFPHPHNMYLETLLDNGILGSTPIFLFWGMMLFYSARLFRSDNRLYTAVGGLSLA